ncbi:CGNR zinc finger domain-containing protein [Frankia sp. CNm7]|uniref:CGNR zinc finger domain-containing protein n=1 Tax=Frankia nepalensis TaxID=1836974 RepID=A0A937RFB4_9ACTN|nr:CGNR zinc finger domain-containing protein [Frankia nepalensis]MBL7495697.1 CGNR zinc finger domain-containing protein [Frankia nepalensis]MBL7511376.1 CGNR zinc finger domain-containing protein [Frankia nepalensis]MBL7521459.1 CGNR zinc finger domain-containing protein [Frankia nepalensis]MBL7631146.1 CGNR zinc finger domain-containing protein [Frankia nepalensis]
MLFTHDTEQSLLAAAWLVNSAEPPDTLETIDQLDDFFDEFRYTGRRDEDEAELAAVRALRPSLRRLLTSDRDAAAELTNRLLADARAVPRLVRHAGFDWHIHAVPPDAPFATRIMAETAMAMVDLIRLDELSRLSVCAADTCEGLVVDLSRNRSRRFCSTTCGNREAVAAYRARRSGRVPADP